jgi:hypothetical protein
MTLGAALLDAIKHLPNAARIRVRILGRQTMSLCQQIIAAVYSITNQEEYGFYVAEEPVLIERIIEIVELPFNGESVAEVKSRLAGVMPALHKIGVDVVKDGDFITVFGPGVLKKNEQ